MYIAPQLPGVPLLLGNLWLGKVSFQEEEHSLQNGDCENEPIQQQLSTIQRSPPYQD